MIFQYTSKKRQRRILKILELLSCFILLLIFLWFYEYFESTGKSSAMHGYLEELNIKEYMINFLSVFSSFMRRYMFKPFIIIAWVLTIFRLVRLPIITCLAVKGMAKKTRGRSHFRPFVSVLIPAHNEENVISKSIYSVLESDYENFEIIVINDGSTDNTAKIVQEIAKASEKLRLVNQQNKGKCGALNRGISEAKSDFIVTIDADTIVLKNTMEKIIAPFSDKKVDGVCGVVIVGNDINLLTGFQSIEYMCDQIFNKSAFSSIKNFFVIPGAAGAWRKESLERIGGYSYDTMAEDCDLTLTMLENEGKLVYQPEAKTITEVPLTVKQLVNQRLRWNLGALQCFWKHKKSFFEYNNTTLILYDILILKFMISFISPITYLIFLVYVIEFMMFQKSINYMESLIGLLIIVDFLYSLISIKFSDCERKKIPRYIWLIVLEQVSYWILICYTCIASVFMAIIGNKFLWNKQARTNTVDLSHVDF